MYGKTKWIIQIFWRKGAQRYLCERGNILISTLSACREYEDSEKGDSTEGICEFTNNSNIIGKSNDKIITEEANRLGFEIIDCENVTFENNTAINYIDDAFLLCLTSEKDRKILKDNFGEYGVKITNVEKFQDIINEALCSKFKFKNIGWRRGFVEYQEKEFSYNNTVYSK